MILCMSLPTDQALRTLRSLIDRLELTVRAAAKLVKIDNTVLQDWYNGTRTPKSQKSLENLERAVTTLAEMEKAHRKDRGEGHPRKNEEDLKRIGVRLVKVVDKHVDKDRPSGEFEKMIEVMDWGTDSERRGFVIPDDAMEGDLSIGQTIIADDSIRVDPNHICLISTHDGERMVRYASGPPSERVFRANDPQYPPYPASKVDVLGVIVEVRTPLPNEEEARHLYAKGMRRKNSPTNQK